MSAATPWRWTDADGTALPLLCRVGQIRICPQGGALASRARQWCYGVVPFQRWFTSPAKVQTRLPQTAWVQQVLLTTLRDTTAAR